MEKHNSSGQIQHGIEQRIDTALINCIRSLNAKELLLIKYELIEDLNKEYSDEKVYWMAYCSENLAILYAQINEIEKEEREIKEGVKLLESVENKDSEHLSLLGMMDGYAIKFCSPIRIPKHIEKCKNYAKEALQLFDKNPRAYLTVGIFDFYTHESYGGGNQTESYLKNAIEYIDEHDPESCIKPLWGLNLAYEFLVKYLMKNNNREQADLYWDKAITLFPNDRKILNLKKQM